MEKEILSIKLTATKKISELKNSNVIDSYMLEGVSDIYGVLSVNVSGLSVEVGDTFFMTLANELSKKIWFLHHFDRDNQGDVKSGPYNYFNFRDYGLISWDKSVLSSDLSPNEDGDIVIHGGGIYFTRNKPRLERIVDKSKFFIGWGVGLDSRIEDDNFFKKYDLLGTRERNSHLIDNDKVFYVPCASCMHEVFDNREFIVSREISVHLNGGFNEALIKKYMPPYEETRTTSNFNDLINNIACSEIVLTNSYHGAYWGSLMGKKVICVPTKVPKWDGLHDNVFVVRDMSELQESIKQVKSVPLSYRDECRDINIDFYNRVAKLIL